MYFCFQWKALILLWSVAQVIADDVPKRTAEVYNLSSIVQEEKLANTTIKNGGTFLSRISSWLFPSAKSRSDNNDLIAAADSNVPFPYYGAPTTSADCNICNQSPWIPIFGQKNIPQYGPPKEFSSHFIENNNIEDHLGSHSSAASNIYGTRTQNSHNPQHNNFISSNNQYFLPAATVHVVDYMIPPPIQYKIPQTLYGSPPKPNYGLPNRPIYGPPPKLNYGPPKVIYGPPKPIYGPPNSPLKPNYGPPKPIYGPPQNSQFPSLLKPQGGYELKQTFSKPHHSVNNFPQSQIPLYNSPPQNLYNQNYHVPSSSNLGWPSYAQNYDNSVPQYNTYTESNNFLDVPSDSYGAPVTNENLELADTISSSSGDFDEQYDPQIIIPILSSVPALPIRNHRNFKKDFTSKSLQFEEKHRTTTDVQIQPSVELVNYLASIEHPINVIQSPVVDVSVKEPHDYQQGDQNVNQNQVVGDILGKISQFENKYENNYDNVPKSEQNPYSQNIQEEIAKEGFNNKGSVSLNDNPIIVEDIHYAASDISNATTISREAHIKRDNDKQTASASHGQLLDHSVNNTQTEYSVIQQLLFELDKKVLKDTTAKTSTPKIDYTAWQPTSSFSTLPTSMVPPPMYSPSTWDASRKNQNSLQIIVPYTNKKNYFHGKDWSMKTKWQSPKETYTTLGSVNTPPMPTEQSLWSRFVNDLKFAENKNIQSTGYNQHTTTVYNINDLLANSRDVVNKYESTPYTALSLQKNIDNWTQQSYGDTSYQRNKSSSKNIPDEFFSTQPYTTLTETPIDVDEDNNLETAASNSKNAIVDSKGKDLFSERPTTTESSVSNKPTKIKQIPEKPIWSTSQVTESTQTKEKVYVVTPHVYGFITSTPATAWSMAPKVENGKTNNGTNDSQKFSVRIESDNEISTRNSKVDNGSAIRVVYSEWPHMSKYKLIFGFYFLCTEQITLGLNYNYRISKLHTSDFRYCLFHKSRNSLFYLCCLIFSFDSSDGTMLDGFFFCFEY